ncbi:protein kinase [Roseateles sp. DC23W]|uniref:Protein kinase n=1 Tax=Pelomonas dachongensis TaxID=3299029 RepID=A0ABW7ETN7_9BURK
MVRLNTSDLIALSRLLDEALAVPAQQRAAWLAAIDNPRWRDELARMLADHARLDESGAFATLPRLAPREAAPGQPGERIGPWRLVEEIGRGGMGSVWRAERADGVYEREVALKLPRRTRPGDAALAERLAAELRIAARLEHPLIARLYDAGLDARGRPYLAMELVAGLPLLEHARPLDMPAQLGLLAQIARAVAHAHSRGVIHCDLKPGNVRVAADGTPRLLDFGIATLRGSGGMAATSRPDSGGLTPTHAAPEQLAGAPATEASDVYSLGVLAYEMLCGELPHGRTGARSGATPLPASERCADPARQRALRGALDALLQQALSPDPAQRPGSASAFAAALEHEQQRLGPAGRRQRRAVATASLVGAAVFVALGLGAGVAVMQAQRAAHASEREQAARDFVAEVFKLQSAAASSAGQTPQDLLARSSALIEPRFEPAARAEMYGGLSRLLADMGAPRLAADVGSRRLAALHDAKADARVQADALRQQAAVQLDAREPEAAGASARQALDLQPGDVEAELLMLRSLVARHRFAEAAPRLAALEARLPSAGGGGLATAWAQSLRGRLLQAENRRDEATPLLLRSISTALVAAGPHSLDLVALRLAAAEALLPAEQAREMQAQLDAALATLDRLGGAHAVRSALVAARMAAARYTGFFQISAEEALATIRASRARLAERGQALPDEITAPLDLYEATVLARQGDAAAALPLLERSRAALESDARTPPERLRLGHTLGEIYETLGRHAEADRYYRLALQARIDGGYGQHPVTAFQYMSAALNLSAAGRTADALALLDQAPAFPPVRGEGAGNPNRYADLVTLARARTLLDAGRTADALATLPAALLVPGADRVSRYDAQVALALRGEARCALPAQRRAGLDDLQQSLTLARRTRDDPLDTDLARLHAVAGQCALALGDPALVRREAERAQAAFTRLPAASDYRQQPLRRLKTALAASR